MPKNLCVVLGGSIACAITQSTAAACPDRPNAANAAASDRLIFVLLFLMSFPPFEILL